MPATEWGLIGLAVFDALLMFLVVYRQARIVQLLESVTQMASGQSAVLEDLISTMETITKQISENGKTARSVLNAVISGDQSSGETTRDDLLPD